MLGEDTVVIIGSQSILASFSEVILPAAAMMSAEADVLALDDEDELKADMVDGLLGEVSSFAEKYGIYADGVSPWTARLPSGWVERVVRIEDPQDGAIGLCLHPEDLCVAKVLAGRGKDLRFLMAVFEAGLVDPEKVALCLGEVALRPSESEAVRQARRFLGGVPRLARYAKGPTPAVADIDRLHQSLARLSVAALLCGRANRDGSICRNDRRSCVDHP
jgi:hypothetical protein